MKASDDEQINIQDYLAIVRLRKWTIVVSVVLVTAAAIAFSVTRTPLYTSTARVLIEPIAGETSIPSFANQVDVQTQVEVIASESVAAIVAEELDLAQDVESILQPLVVAAQGETQVIRISYTARSAADAQRIAQSFAESYIGFRRSEALRDVEAEEERVTTQIESVTDRLSGITESLAAAAESGDEALAASLETQRSVLIARLGVLQQQIDDVLAQRSQSATSGQIIEPAARPQSPSSPNHPRNAVLGLFLGGILGVALAFVRERLDDRFRGRADVEEALGVPVLATVPRYPSPKKDQSPLVSVSQASVGAVEAYRSLRTNLQFMTSQRNLRSVLVTSPSESEGKSATTANLGVLLAQAGKRVILMSSDLRRPMLGRYFDLVEGHEDEPGLSSWLASDEDTPWSVLRDPGIPNLRVIPSGPLPPNPAELLTSPRTRALVQMLEANADLVLCDSPPVLAVADAAELASVLGGTVLVVNAQSTHRSASAHARQELERVGGRLIGAVLNAFDPSTSPYYYSTYTAYQPGAPEDGDADGAARKGGGRKRRKLASRR